VLRERLPAAPRWAAAEHFPQARDIARLAAPHFSDGTALAAEQALPVYLRDKVALTLAEQGR
jgi:tRNA threonylcarbamoyladenosine biosynthesis protein TsaB